MSILAALIFVQAAPAAPPLPAFVTPPSDAVAQEIVAIDRKMKSWKGGVYPKDGQLTCRISESTGDDDIDAIRCGAMLRCVAPAQADFDRIAALDIAKADREARLAVLAESLQPCIEAAHEAGMRYLAEMRVAAR